MYPKKEHTTLFLTTIKIVDQNFHIFLSNYQTIDPGVAMIP